MRTGPEILLSESRSSLLGLIAYFPPSSFSFRYTFLYLNTLYEILNTVCMDTRRLPPFTLCDSPSSQAPVRALEENFTLLISNPFPPFPSLEVDPLRLRAHLDPSSVLTPVPTKAYPRQRARVLNLDGYWSGSCHFSMTWE